MIIFQREGSWVLGKERHSGFSGDTNLHNSKRERIYNCKGFLFVFVFKCMLLRKGRSGTYSEVFGLNQPKSFARLELSPVGDSKEGWVFPGKQR